MILYGDTGHSKFGAQRVKLNFDLVNMFSLFFGLVVKEGMQENSICMEADKDLGCWHSAIK